MILSNRNARLDAKKEAFPHQIEALRAIQDMPFAAVFHEPGLGKTKIGIDLVLYWLSRNIVDSALIVTKKSLIENWRAETTTHSHLTARVLGQDRNANFYAFNSPARLYLTHYETVLSERKRLELFLKTRRVGVVLDEAHKIKNPEAEITEALQGLAPGFVRRVIMTGTPVANRPFDIWSQIRFLDSGACLGTDFPTFKKSLDLANDLESDKSKIDEFATALAEIFEKVRPFSIRETKKSAGINLPDKTILNLSVPLEAAQKELYERFRDEMVVVVQRDENSVLDDAESILKRLLRLVQVASNPRLVDEAYSAIPGKLPKLIEMVEKIVLAGEKVVVWTAFTENAEWLTKELERFGVAEVHGALGMAVRELALRNFKTDPSCHVLVATPGAAKEGLTLTVANHAIFFDRTFSLDDYLQAQDRIHRISQDRPCFVTNLLADGTVDEWVDALLGAKHLAAQLSQGDISRSEYDAKADYSFGAILRKILKLETREA